MDFRRFFKMPIYYLSIGVALLRGTFYIVYFRIQRKNVSIKFPFLAHTKVSILGQGTVSIGKRCSVFLNEFKGLTIVTLSNKASVKIGDRCSLGGLTIRCHDHIELGNNVMTANSLIQDSLLLNYHESIPNLTSFLIANNPIRIVIGDNVWLGSHSCVLSGSKIGNDCVLSAYSVCHACEIKDYNLAAGNPIRRSLPISNLLRLR